jgi:CRISPR-associated protein Csm3
MRLIEFKDINGIIELKTGLRVGGSTDTIEIGGNDSPVIRNPRTGEVYIPGSSIKGKMRYLTEWLEGKIESTGNIHSCGDIDCPVCRVFGRSANDSKHCHGGPTRIIVRDAYLLEESKEELKELKNRTGSDTEIKYENNINRLTSEAHPRNNERVPAGSKFHFNISYKVLDINDDGKTDEKLFEKVVLKGLKALLLEGLGGGVSRGNGKIEFLELTSNGEDIKEQVSNMDIGGINV